MAQAPKKTTTRKNGSKAEASFASHGMAPATFKTGVETLSKTGKELQELARKLANAAFLMSLPTDMGGSMNATPALDVYHACPDVLRKEALRTWFQRYTNIRITSTKQDNGTITIGAKMVGPKSEDYKPLTNRDIMKAIDTPFWTLVAVEGVVKDIDDLGFAKALDAFLARMAKAQDDGRLKLSDGMTHRLDTLKKMAPGVHQTAEKAMKDALAAAAKAQREAA